MAASVAPECEQGMIINPDPFSQLCDERQADPAGCNGLRVGSGLLLLHLLLPHRHRIDERKQLIGADRLG